MTNHAVTFYDSLGRTGYSVCKLVLNFIAKDYHYRKSAKFDLEQWTIVSHLDGLPKQNNDSDCGIFIMQYAEYLARGKSLHEIKKCISAQKMILFREMICFELFTGKLNIKEL